MLELLSHPAEGGIKEKKLTDHLLNVANAIENKIAIKTLNLKLIETEKLVRLGRIIGLMHDLGKATVFFQKYLRGNAKRSQLTNHSLISATACHSVLREEFKEDQLCNLLAYAGFHVVYRHHGNLVAFDMQDNSCNFGPCKDQLQNMIGCYWDELTKFYGKNGIELSILKYLSFKKFKSFLSSDESAYIVEDSIASDDDKVEFFFMVNFLFSLLIESDKEDAARLNNEYFKDNLDEPLIDVNGFLQYCREKDPGKFNPQDPVNDLRNSFLSEIETNINITPERHFFSITAPTGIGKTFGCMAFAEKLKTQLPKGSGRIIYCLPYTSIIDQNYQEFEKIIQHTNSGYMKRPTRYLLKHHCLTQKEVINRKKGEYRYKDYLDDRLLVESWQSSMVVTTFVQLFHTIIGNGNRFLKKFHNIINSIVILDEVQSIDPDYYRLIKAAFKVLGERFNTYFVLVTATQPEILNERDIVQVVEHSKYMIASPFNRVRLIVKPEFSTLESFTDYFTTSFQGQNCLIVMNTIKYAQQLYHDLKNHFQKYKIYCLTTRLTPRDRGNQITEIQKHLKKTKEKIIVVSTQLVEAGVDLSFKRVYRDFGPMDSIIQVAGRCNRHCEYGILGGEMILLNLNNHRIYKPILSQYVNQTIQENYYESKNFIGLSKDYFDLFNFSRKSNEILLAIFNLNYDQKIEGQIPVSDFALIEDQQSIIKIFILQTHEAQENMDKLLINLKRLKESNLSKKEKDNILVETEQLKYRLNQFSISVSKDSVLNYQSILEPHEIKAGTDFPYRYFSYENQKKYTYDKRLGLLTEPKISLSETLNF